MSVKMKDRERQPRSITIPSRIDIHLHLSSSLKSQALPAHGAIRRTESAESTACLVSAFSPKWDFSVLPLVYLLPPLSTYPPPHPFPCTPLPFSLHPSFTFHIPPLVTPPTMYRWFGSRLSPSRDVTPVPPTPPFIHCQRCSRTFQDDRAYHQHMRTSDHHHLCQRCGNDHETHRALQVVSKHLCASQSHFISRHSV